MSLILSRSARKPSMNSSSPAGQLHIGQPLLAAHRSSPRISLTIFKAGVPHSLASLIDLADQGPSSRPRHRPDKCARRFSSAFWSSRCGIRRTPISHSRGCPRSRSGCRPVPARTCPSAAAGADEQVADHQVGRRADQRDGAGQDRCEGHRQQKVRRARADLAGVAENQRYEEAVAAVLLMKAETTPPRP